jgi:hypothetical protein
MLLENVVRQEFTRFRWLLVINISQGFNNRKLVQQLNP